MTWDGYNSYHQIFNETEQWRQVFMSMTTGRAFGRTSLMRKLVDQYMDEHESATVTDGKLRPTPEALCAKATIHFSQFDRPVPAGWGTVFGIPPSSPDLSKVPFYNIYNWASPWAQVNGPREADRWPEHRFEETWDYGDGPKMPWSDPNHDVVGDVHRTIADMKRIWELNP